MSDWKIKDHTNDRFRDVDSRSDGEDTLEEWEGELELELLAPDGRTMATNWEDNREYDEPETDGGDMDVEVIDETEGNEPEATEVVETEPATEPSSTMQVLDNFSIDEDPLDVLPGWMTTQVSYSDKGDSSTTINKRGCQVIAEYLGLEPEMEAIESAPETDFEYAHYRCTITKPDGRTFQGHGIARSDDADQGEGSGWKLEMMAETRAYKRAVKSATGGGLEAFVKESQQ